jgi:hypothetical protein
MSGTAPAELQGERALDVPVGTIGEPSLLDSPAPGEDAAEAWDVLDARNGGDRPYDEGLFDGPQVTEADKRLGRALDRLDLRELCEQVAGEAGRRGVCFGSADGEQEFRIDPIPRLIDAAEWRRLSAGVAQRVRALELFVRDVYGERRIVREGVVPARAIDGADHHEPLLDGAGERIGTWITVAGLDIVRDSDGTFKVLEDNWARRRASPTPWPPAKRCARTSRRQAACTCARWTPPSTRSPPRCAPPRRKPRAKTRPSCC